MSQRVSCPWRPDSNPELSGKAGAVQQLQLFRRFEPIQAGHVEVEYHHAGLKGNCAINRMGSAEYYEHFSAKDAQEGP